jgi:tetratricopeptide (TPR) repeat protein
MTPTTTKQNYPLGTLCWSIHHETLIESLAEPFETRVNYIETNKSQNEINVRLKCFCVVKRPDLLPKEVVKACADYHKAYADYHKAYADYDKAYTDYVKACADYHKTYADYHKAYADYHKACTDCDKAYADLDRAGTDSLPLLLKQHHKEYPELAGLVDDRGHLIFPS